MKRKIVFLSALFLFFSLVFNAQLQPIFSASADSFGLHQAASVPVITTHPSDVYICSGAQALFFITATGTSLTYRWYHSGQLISGVNNDTLLISNVGIADTGQYYCVVSEGADSVASNTARLVLLSPADIGQNRVPATLNFGLIAHYPLDGNYNDVSPYANHGASGGNISVATDRHGNASGAYSFSGNGSYIMIPNQSQLNNNNTLSISFWSKTNTLNYPSLGLGMTVSKGNSGAYQYYMAYQSGGTPSVNAWQSGGAGHLLAAAPENFADNNWHLITGIIHNNDKAEIYIDGILVAVDSTPSGSWCLSGTGNLYLGCYPGNTSGSNFSGLLDDVRMYNRALTQVEIQYLYNQGNPLSAQVLYDTVCDGYSSVFKLLHSEPAVLYTVYVNGLASSLAHYGNGDDLFFIADSSVLFTGNNQISLKAKDTNSICEIILDTLLNIYSGICCPLDIGEPDFTYTQSYHSGMISFYPFNGNANDEGPYHNHGAVNGASLTDDRFGNPNSAYLFNGVSNFIEIPNKPFLNNNDELTLSAWIKTSVAGSGSYIVSKGHASGYQYNLSLSGAKPAVIAWQQGGANHLMASSPLNITDGNWHLITGVIRKNTDAKVYIDGVLVDEDLTPSGIWHQYSIGSLIIGRHPALLGYYFNGAIDDICLYNRALEQQEIQYMFNQGNVLNADFMYDTICQGNYASVIRVFHSEPTVKYTLYNGAVSTAQQFTGNGETLYFVADSSVLLPGNNNLSVRAENASNNCSIFLDTVFQATMQACCPPDIGETDFSYWQAYHPGLIAYYPFDGNADDNSPFANNGIIYGAQTAPDRFGNPSSAFSFNGTNAYIEIPNKPFLNNNSELTLSVWIKTSASGASSYILSKAYSSAYQYNLSLSAGKPSVIAWQSGGANNLMAVSPQQATDNHWHHVVGVIRDQTDAKLYIDGVLVDTDITPSGIWTQNSLGNIIIGKHPVSSTQYFNGIIDEVAIYNRALDSNEIRQIFYQGNILSFNATGADTLCDANGFHSITLHETQNIAIYQAYIDANPYGQAYQGSGDSLMFIIPDTALTFGMNILNIRASNLMNNCSLFLDSALNVIRSSHTLKMVDTLICRGDTYHVGNHVYDSAGIYTDSLYNYYGCDSVIITQLAIGELPVPVVTSNSPVCVGEDIELNETGTSSVTWYWNGPGGFTSMLYTNTISNASTSNEGMYYVVISDTNNCYNSDSVFVLVNLLPQVQLNLGPPDTVCMQLTQVLLGGGTPSGGAYSGDAVSGNIFNPSAASLGWNVITYTYMNTDSCSNMAIDSIYVSACAGIDAFHSDDVYILLYPNPAKTAVRLYCNQKLEGSMCVLYDKTGRQVKSINIEMPYTLINVEDLSGGMYFLNFSEINKVLKLLVDK